MIERNIVPDTLTDQTSAHDPLIGYVPHTINNTQANIMREQNPQKYLELAYASMKRHVELMIELQARGAITFDYGNNLRARAKEAGLENAFDFPGFVPAYIRPLFCEGKGPFRWAALSGDPNDIAVTDELIANMFPENESLQRWLRLAKNELHSRDCLRGYAGLAREKEKRQGLHLMNW